MTSCQLLPVTVPSLKTSETSLFKEEFKEDIEKLLRLSPLDAINPGIEIQFRLDRAAMLNMITNDECYQFKNIVKNVLEIKRSVFNSPWTV